VPHNKKGRAETPDPDQVIFTKVPCFILRIVSFVKFSFMVNDVTLNQPYKRNQKSVFKCGRMDHNLLIF